MPSRLVLKTPMIGIGCEMFVSEAFVKTENSREMAKCICEISQKETLGVDDGKSNRNFGRSSRLDRQALSQAKQWVGWSVLSKGGGYFMVCSSLDDVS